MRIILDQGIFDMRNMGQNALLQAAIERIKKLWPQASIGVTTFAPYLLKIFFPDVFPVSPDGSHSWFKNSIRYNKFHQFMPVFVIRALLEFREDLWHKWPTAKKIETVKNIPSNSVEIIHVDRPNYTDVVSSADLFVATGSQYLCDHARDTAFQVLDRLEASIRLGIPTAMVGQGVGPIDDQELRARAGEVLPLVDLILVRERVEAPKLLASLGVKPERILVTGDDAIELAYNARTSALGTGIGISMRCMPSTMVGDRDITVIGRILREAARKYDAELVGLPISMSIHERDDRCTQWIMDGYGKKWMSRKKFQTPLGYIKDMQRCCLVVTGTFHGAVLALAQGIPVICLVRSDLYANKFKGLADLFNPGCEIISLEDENLQERLISSIDSTRKCAKELRVGLLESAARQIEWRSLAYKKLFDLVEHRNGKTIQGIH